MPFPAAPLVVRRKYLAVMLWPLPRCSSRVLNRGAQANARGATHVLDRCVQAVARGAARCALHIHGRGAKTDACGRSFALLSTHVSAVGFRLS